MALKVENIEKSYGNKKVVDNVSFSMEKPGVFGLLGSNGAGKTTSIRMILGIIKKDNGNITWNGKSVIRENVNFGYLPEERGIYPKIKVYNQLMYFAELKGMNKETAEKEIKYWLKKLEIEEYENMTAEKLSKGNQQKVQFLTAILSDPELIVLDEPFSGLDPINTKLLKQIVEELTAKGKFIIMSSHQMELIEEFAEEIIILKRGKTIVKGNLNDIKNGYPSNRLELKTKKSVTDIIKKLNLEIEDSKNNNYEIHLKEEAEAYKLYELLNADNTNVIKFEIKKPSLNDIFIEKVGKNE